MFGVGFLLLSFCIYLYQVPAVPRSSSGTPRYDIQRELHNLDGKFLTGFIIDGGSRLSNNGRVVSRNIFKAHELVVRFRESTTTYPEFVADGQKMNGLYSGASRYVEITYLDGIQEKFVKIPTSPGDEELLFGPVCGRVISDLWKLVSESKADQVNGS